LSVAYGRFVPYEFLRLLNKESIVDVQLGDQVHREMSILFSDIRDFTSLSETMTPEENFKFINAYLSRMESAIIENKGFIDKYIGDAIMALFSGNADEAVNAGIAILQTLVQYNQHRARSGYAPIKIGIGINTGSSMLGTVGGKNRMDGTVIGDAVNLASRLETLTKEYGVSLLISHQTLARLHNPTEYSLRFIDQVKVKGKSKAVAVFEVFDGDEPRIKEGKLATKAIFEEGLFLYHQQAFREAALRLEAVLRINPRDTVAQIYLQRCHSQGDKNLLPSRS
jgi:class 3 adenylate cyclase